MAESFMRELWRRGVWLCPLVAMGLLAGMLTLFGVRPWTALLAALLLVCPALLLWGLVTLSRSGK
jgi:Na+/H+-dicarboxylate symporter